MTWSVESTLYLEVKNHPAWEGGFVETRRSAQSWRWRSAIIKDFTVLRSRSNPFLVTKLVLGFASWMESTSTGPKRQKKFLLQALRTEVQGNLSRRLKHDRSRLEHWLLFLLLLVNENWKTSFNEDKVVLKCQNSWSDCYDMMIQFIEKMMEQ